MGGREIRHKKDGPRISGAVFRAFYLLHLLRGLDLNQRPLGYEPSELPDCSTARIHTSKRWLVGSAAGEARGFLDRRLGRVDLPLVARQVALS
jgi:hypothetical protein